MISCICQDTDAELATISDTQWRKARREHRCCECGGVIAIGQTYQWVRGLWDGSWETYKTCRPCATIRSDFFSCYWTYGQLWQDLQQLHVDDDDGASSWLKP